MSNLTQYRPFQVRFYRSDDATKSVIAPKDNDQGPIPPELAH